MSVEWLVAARNRTGSVPWLGMARLRVKAALSAQCDSCANFEGPYRAGYHCQAFPGGIPKDILEGRFDHEMPYPGDHGVRFEEENE